MKQAAASPAVIFRSVFRRQREHSKDCLFRLDPDLGWTRTARTHRLPSWLCPSATSHTEVAAADSGCGPTGSVPPAVGRRRRANAATCHADVSISRPCETSFEEDTRGFDSAALQGCTHSESKSTRVCIPDPLRSECRPPCDP